MQKKLLNVSIDTLLKKIMETFLKYIKIILTALNVTKDSVLNDYQLN